jgi:outer membrane protein assembly factor BamB
MFSKRGFSLFLVSFLSFGVPIGNYRGVEAASTAKIVDDLIDRSEIWKGVVTVLGAENQDLALDLARSGDYFVHLLDPDGAKAVSAQAAVDVEGLYGKQIVAEKSPFDILPYADNTIDIYLNAHATPDILKTLSTTEIVRTLRPEGLAFIGSVDLNSEVTEESLKNWLAERQIQNAEVFKNNYGVWAQIEKPPLEGVDEWSHWEKTPGNNPVSNDQVIKAPYMTHFLAEPYYTAMPAITTIAGGRTFLAMGHIAHHEREEPWLNTLIARNGYNGTILWQRKLPDGYLVHRSAFIATKDVFYMIDPSGSGVLKLDPQTGDELGRIRPRRFRGDWKWIAMKDGKLYALVGKEKDPAEMTVVRSEMTHWSWGELSKGYYEERVPWGFGQTVLSLDTSNEEVLWSHEEEKDIDSRSLVMGGGNIFFYGPDSHIGCIDEKTGQLVWTNPDPKTRELIEEPGVGLQSTPGFKTAVISIYTPNVLAFQGQTRMNVVAVSTKDGSLLWSKKKTTNNPNMLYLEDKLLVGVGEGGSTLMVDPVSGAVEKDLGITKRSCARLTATPDSLFARGTPDGIVRFDRTCDEVTFNGAVRPACNDGVIGAGGLLHISPWLCDCNLTLMGNVVLCSAGSFQFDFPVREEERLEPGEGNVEEVSEFEISDSDWPTYRGDNSRNSASSIELPDQISKVWQFSPEESFEPTAPVSAGGLVFYGGDDCKVRAIDAEIGVHKWTYRTAGPILAAPSVWNGRVYFGSGDGYIYCLEAESGRLLWRFRASPVERRIMVYGSLSSTWPVNSGVLVQDGVAYAAAGIIDYDGTYVYALDAKTGKLEWCNNTSGHLDKKLRKGASAQGFLTIADGKLFMAAGNIVSPAPYDLETGEYLGQSAGDGSPQTNRGEEIGALDGKYIVQGGRLRFSATKNVVNPGYFSAYDLQKEDGIDSPIPLNQGKIPPAWNKDRLVYVNGLNQPPIAWGMEETRAYFESADKKQQPTREWSAASLDGSDTVSLALASNGAVAVSETPVARQIETQWSLSGLSGEDGSLMWQAFLSQPAIPGGLSIDGGGRMVVALEDGTLSCFGSDETLRNFIASLKNDTGASGLKKEEALTFLASSLEEIHTPGPRQMITEALAEVGVIVGKEAKEKGCIVDWNLLGPVPWDPLGELNQPQIGEPAVDLAKEYNTGGRQLSWKKYTTEKPTGMVDLAKILGRLSNVAAYGYAEIELDKDQDLYLKTGSNDGMVCWFNGEEVGRFDGGRSYGADQDTFPVKGRNGTNTILIKVNNYGMNWAFSVRVTDQKEEPVKLVDAR